MQKAKTPWASLWKEIWSYGPLCERVLRTPQGSPESALRILVLFPASWVLGIHLLHWPRSLLTLIIYVTFVDVPHSSCPVWCCYCMASNMEQQVSQRNVKKIRMKQWLGQGYGGTWKGWWSHAFVNKHFCKTVLAVGHTKINGTRSLPLKKSKISAQGTDKDKSKFAQNHEIIVPWSSNRTLGRIVVGEGRVRERYLLWAADRLGNPVLIWN